MTCNPIAVKAIVGSCLLVSAAFQGGALAQTKPMAKAKNSPPTVWIGIQLSGGCLRLRLKKAELGSLVLLPGIWLDAG